MSTETEITKHIDDRFFVASYLAVMEKMYGMLGLFAGRELIKEVRQVGRPCWSVILVPVNPKARPSRTSSIL